MPTLHWIGKDAVVGHHHSVPFRLLRDEPSLACGAPGSGNLLVEGDNLLALKALLPRYAGRVKCIYIDPPYNTGNEGWVYNDAVNSPTIKDWLGKTVGKEAEDLCRHDKWLCMMYPRLALLKEFLREDGVIFVSLDDTEASHARLVLEEIFGATNLLAVIAWEKRYTRSNNAKMFYSTKDTILAFRKSDAVSYLREARTEKSDSIYKNPDNDPRGPWTSASYVNPATKAQRPNLVYTITNPHSGAKIDHPTHAWKVEWTEHLRHVEERRLWWGKDGDAKYPRLKVFPKTEGAGPVPVDVWSHGDSGTTDEAGAELKSLFGSATFDTPKPTKLLERILKLATAPGDLILDSFAGSGTTAHAVLKLNAENPDKPARQFIAVEMEGKIAREITAERIRRVASGYKNAKGEAVAGLGGAFRFCTLGEELFDAEGGIRREVSFEDLARFVWFTATGEPFPLGEPVPYSPLLGVHADGTAIYLLYNGVLDDLSPGGGNILTRDLLEKLPAHAGQKLVYAAGCRLSPEALARAGILFRKTPTAIHPGALA